MANKDLFGNTLKQGTVTGGSIPTFNAYSGSKRSSKSKSGIPIYSYYGYNSDDIYNSIASSYGVGSYSGGGGYTPVKADISGLLASLEQKAASAKQTAENTYNTTRNDLLTSLKRFQEQNAKDQQNQKQQYLTGQSELEFAREQANRQSRIDAAARGIGGSGLQQLAQLQNLLGQSGEISQLANENQAAMDNLRELLRQEEEDTNTNLEKALTTYNDTINNIDADLAAQKNQAIYENEMAYAQAQNDARARAASAASSQASAVGQAQQAAQAIVNTLSGYQDSLKASLNSINSASKSELKKAYGTSNKQSIANKLADSTYASISELLNTYGLSGSVKNSAIGNMNTLLSQYGYSSNYGKGNVRYN